MRFQIVTLFPELLQAFADAALIAKAKESGVLRIETITPREFATDKHRTVDDAPYGGGSGMVMMPEPLLAAIEALDAAAVNAGGVPGHRVLLSPQGTPFTQAHAERLAALPGIVLVCGRYEGMDDRVAEFVNEQISLGDFVLSGGEVAAMALIEAVARLLPGMLGNAGSLTGRAVPEVLLSGNHARIARYRRKQALLRTRERRPDLFARFALTDADRALLDEPEERS